MTPHPATIIVVTYNSADVIDECLAFVSEISPAIEVVVVDNASADTTVDKLEGYGEKIRLIRSRENLGFARAVNLAVQTVAGNRTIVLLNPDAVANASTLETLIDSVGDSIGIAAPSIVHPGGALRIASAGRAPTTWRMFTHYSGLSHLPGSQWEGHYLRPTRLSGVREVDWATGACMAISRRAWDQVGGLSERWFMYAEDIKLCEDVRSAGYVVMLYPELVATHLVGHSSAADPVVNSSWILNLYDYFRTDLASGRFDRRAWKVVVSLGLLSRSVAFRLTGRRRNARRFSAYARDLWHAS